MGRSEAAKNDFDSALKLDPANEQKLRPIIEAEVAALPGQSPPSTAPPPPQQPATAQRVERPSSTVPRSQETPPQKTPFERCLALGDRENNQHVDNCVRRYGNRAEKQKWFRSLAEDVCTESTDSKSYKSRRSREAERQRCIKEALQKPDELCGGYLGIECKK
jgi:hypothetical protein